MKDKNVESVRELHGGLLDGVDGGGYFPGTFQEEAKAFMRQRMNAETYERIMCRGDGRRYPYVAARIYLGESDWDRYVWIEHHGSLDGFPG